MLLASVLGLALLGAAPVQAAQPYPSWDQVRAAKGNVSDKTAQIRSIEALLADLQDTAAQLGDAAVDARAAYSAVQGPLREAGHRLELLSARKERAAAKAAGLRDRAGALAAESYKTGGTNSNLLLMMGPRRAAANLQRLNVLAFVTDKTSDLYATSAAAEQVAVALDDEAAAAQRQYQRLADQARERLAGAETAQSAARKSISSERAHSRTLFAQLASLKDTSARAEAAHNEGVRAAEAYADQQAAAKAAAELAVRQAAGEAARRSAVETDARRRGDGSQGAAGQAATAQASTDRTGSGPALPPSLGSGPVHGAAPAAAEHSQPVRSKPAAAADPAWVVDSPAAAQAYAGTLVTGAEFQCLLKLWTRESGWRAGAANRGSGAYGIPQSLPGRKMASAGADWRTNYRTQVRWGLGYIDDRYGTPCGAWAHSESNGWY